MRQPPQPLYKRHSTSVKRDPLDFMHSITEGPIDINLEDIAPPTSITEANDKFEARTAAAILFAANSTLPENAIDNEQDYGFKILAKMAYTDYFLGPDQVPGRSSLNTLQEEVNASIESQKVGIVGSSIDFSPIHIHGEYDVLLTAYIKLYYKYYNALSIDARVNLFNNLLSVRGKYDPAEKFSINGSVAGIDEVVTIPETENHRLMIQSAKYLTNQLYYQASVIEGVPDHENFDNNRNGDGDTNPPMVNVVLQMLNNYLMLDFVEYNARPYQDYTMSALMNLVSFSYDDRVRLAARMVLDYVSAKVAVSSQDLRRCPPYRRRNEAVHYGPIIQNGFLGSPLVYNLGIPPEPIYEPDPQIAFYTLLAGNTGVLQSPPGHVPGNYAFEMVHAGLSDYRLPPAILDLFVNRSSRTFCQGFHHYAGVNERANFPGESTSWFIRELYTASPSYLFSAGGVPSYYAYTADIAGLSHPGDDKDLGLAMPTTFIPCIDCTASNTPSGFGTALSDIIQIGKASTDHDIVNLGVAPNFACGGAMYIPEVFEPKAGDPMSVRDGNWTFVNRGSNGNGPGYYLAIFRVEIPFIQENWGFLEAYDTLLHSLSFTEFQESVKATNPSVVLNFGKDQINTYTTQAGLQIKFTIAPPFSTIISTSVEPDQSIYTETFAHGTIVNSPQLGTTLFGSGLITISNPAIGKIILDMQIQNAFGDSLFGLHHPKRTDESGRVESAGSNEEVWVDSHYPGTGSSAGDFGDPFRTLGDAINNVAIGGTIKIINVNKIETRPVVYTKRMTFRAMQGTVALPG